MSEDKLRRDVLRASQATSVLNNDAFKGAVAGLREGVVSKWMDTPDPVEREKCWMAANLLGRIEDALLVAVANGRVAQAEIDQIVAAESKAA